MYKYIFEILLYWKEEKKYYLDLNKKFKKFKNSLIYEDLFGDEIVYSKEELTKLLDKFQRRSGGPWNYNQVVGAIRIYVSDYEIRGDLWFSKKNRYQSVMKDKQIYSVGNIIEIYFDNKMSNSKISLELRNYIEQEIASEKRLHADFECYDNISNYIDWHKLFKEKKHI